jgi:molybdenum cofactor guanylyltransferase
MLHLPVLRLAEITHEVIVVLGPDAPEPAFPPGLAVRLARDAREGEGPLAGLLSGLSATTTELALIAGGDMPGLVTGVLIEMLRVAAGAPVGAVALQDGERFRPLPMVVRTAEARTTAHDLLHTGERRLRALLEALRVAVIDEATWHALDPERATLRDVDVPADLPHDGAGGASPGGAARPHLG